MVNATTRSNNPARRGRSRSAHSAFVFGPVVLDVEDLVTLLAVRFRYPYRLSHQIFCDSRPPDERMPRPLQRLDNGFPIILSDFRQREFQPLLGLFSEQS